jgi:hypothetical protein
VVLQVQATLKELKIRRGRYIYNFNKTRARIRCPRGEEILVSIRVKEHYTLSLEDRHTVTVLKAMCARGKRTLLPGIVTPGKLVIDNWLATSLRGQEIVKMSPSGYTNNRIRIS